MTINEIGKCSNSKIGICLNVLLHYGKYKKLFGRKVRIIKNNGLALYNDYIGKIGFVSNFEYGNFRRPLCVTFYKEGRHKTYHFSTKEIERV